VDDGVAPAHELEEVVFDQVGLDQLNPSWKRGRRGVMGDRANPVPVCDQPGDERPAEHAGGARDEDDHRTA